jgi:amidase
MVKAVLMVCYDKTTEAELVQSQSQKEKQFFETPMVKYQLDAILSINNNNSGHAAVKLPLPYDPYGYKTTGEPWGLTFIARPYQEDAL